MVLTKILQKTATTLIALLAVMLTIAGASAISFSYSSMGSSPFATDGFGTVRFVEQGKGSYGVSWSPQTVAGGWSYSGNSAGFGYDRGGEGLRSVGINTGDVRGSWNRGYTVQKGYTTLNYGSLSIGSAARTNTWSINSYGNAWGSHAAYYSPYMNSWGGYGYNSYGSYY